MAMVYCCDCGTKHSDRACACPKCGRCNTDKSVLVYVLLAFFMGMFGVHKFYAGYSGQGIALLLMGTIGWVLIIPGIIACVWAFIDFIVGLVHMNNPQKIFKK